LGATILCANQEEHFNRITKFCIQTSSTETKPTTFDLLQIRSSIEWKGKITKRIRPRPGGDEQAHFNTDKQRHVIRKISTELALFLVSILGELEADSTADAEADATVGGTPGSTSPLVTFAGEVLPPPLRSADDEKTKL
jgi:hypothetical protein